MIQFQPALDNRIYLIVSIFWAGFSYLLIGPSKLLGFPDSTILIGVGCALAGMSHAQLIV